MRKIFTVALVAVLAMTLSVWAGDKKGGGEGKAMGKGDKAKAFHQEQRGERKEHRAEQKDENEAFRKTLEGMTPEQKEAAIKDFFASQKMETKEHFTEQKNERKEEAKKLKDEVKAAVPTVPAIPATGGK